MLASLARALVVAAAFAVACASSSWSAEPAPAKPAVKKPATGSSKPKAGTTTTKKKPAAKPAVKKPAPPPPPPPPPPVELIGYVVMPPGAFRAGPVSGQYDSDGRRAPAPRFDSQPVQGVSSIKPGPTAGSWWAL